MNIEVTITLHPDSDAGYEPCTLNLGVFPWHVVQCLVNNQITCDDPTVSQVVLTMKRVD